MTNPPSQPKETPTREELTDLLNEFQHAVEVNARDSDRYSRQEVADTRAALLAAVSHPEAAGAKINVTVTADGLRRYAPASPAACPECPLGPGPACNESCEPASPAHPNCFSGSIYGEDGEYKGACPLCASPPNEPEGK